MGDISYNFIGTIITIPMSSNYEHKVKISLTGIQLLHYSLTMEGVQAYNY